MVFSASLFACLAPSASQINATNPSYTSITLHNTGVGPSGKQMQFRIKGTSSWSTTNTFTGNTILVNIQPGTIYQYQGRLNCGIPTGWSTWSDIKEFTSLACPIPSSSQYNAINITESSATLSNTASGTQREVRYKRNSITALTWTNLTSTGQSFAISGLSSNTTYEYQARVICGSHTTSWTTSKTFTTLQSCNAPTKSQLSHTNVTATTATVNTSASGVFRKFRYRRQNTTTWFDSPTNSNNAWTISGLISGTNYEYQASVQCSQNSSWSAYSPSETFTTTQTCPTPSVSQISNSDPTATAVILYNSASGTSKSLRYRRIGTTQWVGYTIASGNSWSISGLTSGITYEFQGSVRCSNGLWSDFSPSKQFTTKHLSVSPTQITFNASNNTARIITVTSNGTWTATSSTAYHGQSSTLHWLRTGVNGSTLPSVTGTNNGTFQIAVLPNSGTTRSGTVTVTSNGITRTINVTQYGNSGRPAITHDDHMEVELSVQSGDDSYSDVINVESRIANNPITESNNTIKIAPNPTNGIFTLYLDVDANETLILDLFNSYGQLINRVSQGVTDTNINKLALDFSMLPAGNYFIKGLIGKKMITEKLMIVK